MFFYVLFGTIYPFHTTKNEYTINALQHKSICDFPSSRFYGGKLQTGKSTSYEEDPPLQIWGNNNDKRHIFCHVEGEEDILTVSSGEGNIMSRSNKEEVKQVVCYGLN